MKSMPVIVCAMIMIIALPVSAQVPGFGSLSYEGQVVRTVVPPASSPQQGRDALYAVMGGTTEQLPVIAVAPGDRGYHGGQWAFHAVTWNVTPYTLTSAAAVLAAELMGDVTVTREPAMDFKCPVQPINGPPGGQPR